MEDMKIKAWLDERGSGAGYGSGYGSDSGSGSGRGVGYGAGYSAGYGSGYGDGYGAGYSAGYGSGDGSGDGYGYGYGDGISCFCGSHVYKIDKVETIITGVHGALAKGYILRKDLSLEPCYVVRGEGFFAHGETAEKANEALRKKIFGNMDEDEAIQKFCETFEPERKYPCLDFYEWHHYLTGSCEMGRKSFMKNHGITEHDTFTVREFIELTEDNYGGDVIKKLKEKYVE